MKLLALFAIAWIPFSQALSAEFDLKWTIPDGIHIYVSYVLAYDTDHDENEELLFTSEILEAPVIFELENDSFTRVHLIDSVPIWSLEVWGVGDFDGDSLSDVFINYYEEVGGFNTYFRVYESRAQDAFPDTLVCDFLLPYQPGVRNKTRIADLDGDGRTEIIDTRYDHEDVWFYENTGDDAYTLVAVDSISGLQNLGSPAIDDFDGDGKLEMAFSDMYGQIAVLETVGDDEHEIVFQGSVPTFARNVYDNLSGRDMDGDGKPEIVLHGFTTQGSAWRDDIFVYESTEDNEYELVFRDSLWPNYTWPEIGAMSDAGDVDGDGAPELVLSTTAEIYVFKAMENDVFDVVWHRNIAQEVGQPIQTTSGNGPLAFLGR